MDGDNNYIEGLNARIDELLEDLDKMTKRCLFAEQQWNAFETLYRGELVARYESIEKELQEYRSKISAFHKLEQKVDE